MKKIKNIILDFGHGGLNENDFYTTYPNKMYEFENGEVAYEGVLNRQIGSFLEMYLKNVLYDLNIITTVAVDDPTDISLKDRVTVANKYDSESTLFISLHCDASLNHNASGFSIYTTEGNTKSDKLAEFIADEVEIYYNEINKKLRFDKIDGDKDKESNFFVLRKTKCPAVLIECLFFDFYDDFKLLKNPKFQSELAYRIHQGIINYINYD